MAGYTENGKWPQKIFTRWPSAQLENICQNNCQNNCKMTIDSYSNLVRLVHWAARDARGPGRESPTYFTSCEDSHRQLSVPLHSVRNCHGEGRRGRLELSQRGPLPRGPSSDDFGTLKYFTSHGAPPWSLYTVWFTVHRDEPGGKPFCHGPLPRIGSPKSSKSARQVHASVAIFGSSYKATREVQVPRATSVYNSTGRRRRRSSSDAQRNGQCVHGFASSHTRAPRTYSREWS